MYWLSISSTSSGKVGGNDKLVWVHAVVKSEE